MNDPNRPDLVAAPIILAVGIVLSWCICRLFKIHNRGSLHLIAILLLHAFLILINPVFFGVAIIPFLLGFIAGRSTRVSLIPTDTFSPRIRLSDVEYAYRAEQHHQFMQSAAANRLLLDPRLSAPDRMAFLSQGFGLYRHARVMALVTSWFYFTIWLTASATDHEGSYVLIGVLSFPQGTALGKLWKYVKGHPGPPRPHIGGKRFRPRFSSFVTSTLYSLIPTTGAGFATYLYYQKHPHFTITIDGFTALICLYWVLQSFAVHLQKLNITDEGIVISGWTSAYGVRWSDMQKAVLRERHNFLSGTDKLLVINGAGERKIAYPISILSKTAQTEVMREVRRRIPTSSVFDSPSL